MRHSHVRRDPVFWAVMMEASAEKADAQQCELLLASFERILQEQEEQQEQHGSGRRRGSAKDKDGGIGRRHFNALLRAHARGGYGGGTDAQTSDAAAAAAAAEDVSGVWQQLRRMRHDYGLEPDEYTISNLLTACERHRDPDHAIEALQLALLLATQAKDEAAAGSSSSGVAALAGRRGGHGAVLRPSMPLLRHAHRIFNHNWGWRRRPDALNILWQLWALGSAEGGGEPTLGGSEFPWWDDASSSGGGGGGGGGGGRQTANAVASAGGGGGGGRSGKGSSKRGVGRPLGAGQGVGARVATVRASQPAGGGGGAGARTTRASSRGGGGGGGGGGSSSYDDSCYKRVDDGSVEVDEVAVEKLLRKRQLARGRRDYEVADKLLKRLFDSYGVVLSDDDRVWAAAAAVAQDQPHRSGAGAATAATAAAGRVGGKSRAARAIERLQNREL